MWSDQKRKLYDRNFQIQTLSETSVMFQRNSEPNDQFDPIASIYRRQKASVLIISS